MSLIRTPIPKVDRRPPPTSGDCIEFDAILIIYFRWPDRWEGGAFGKGASPPIPEDDDRKAVMTQEQRRLRAALDRAERSASWLARKVEVSPMTVSRWLGRAKGNHGARVPEEKRAAVADALDTTVRDLFTEKKGNR